MCTHGRFVTNKYTGSVFWSECGKCKACKQKKAASRSSRIRNEFDGLSLVFLVTLTYDRLSCPYFNQRDFDCLRYEKERFNSVLSPLKIYRSYSVHWIPSKQKYKRIWSPVVLDSKVVDVPSFTSDYLCSVDNEKYCRFHYLEKQPGKIGVIYFKDVQNFIKRLRSYLKFHGYEEKIRIFDVTEYGPQTQRPHAHLLISTRNISEEAFHNAVIACWPFGRRIRDKKSCELVFDDPAGYVSSYVNCHSYVPSFLAEYFPPRHSHSKYFGHGRKSFLLEEVTKAIERGDLSYDLKRSSVSGEQILHLPIPKYVINRFFPLFKGYSRLASSTVLEFLSRGVDIGFLFKKSLEFDLTCNPRYMIQYSIKDTDVPSDLKRIGVRLRHAYDYYNSVFPGSSYFDYARVYQKAWRCYRSCIYKRFVTDRTIPDFYKYDNICLLDPHRQHALHDDLSPCVPFIVENNEKPWRVQETLKMSDYYDKYDKQKKVTGFILARQGIPV